MGNNYRVKNMKILMAQLTWMLMHRFKQYTSNPKINLSFEESILERLINISSNSNLMGIKYL